MDDDQHDGSTDELENVVGTLQAGGDRGEQVTSGNDEDGLEDSTNDGETQTGDDDTSDSDETDDDGGSGGSELARARQQAGRYRRELRETETERDELAAALWTERVRALGVLADPDDLPLDPEALHDPDRLRELADELVTRKPHLRSRRIRERAGQGEGTHDGGVSLAAILNRGA